MLIGAFVANAYDFEYNGIYYNKNGNEVTVTNNYNGVSSYNCNAYTGNVIIPSSFEYNGRTYTVTTIGYEAFYQCYDLYNVVIPNTVTRIETRAFWMCKKLVYINIPNPVTDISGIQTFGCCSSLYSISLPNSLTDIGEHMFENCSSLTNITIPNSVRTIGEFAFWNCISLTGIAIPNSVTTIKNGAFEGCSGLVSIDIPKSVTRIDSHAFLLCSGLTSMTVENGNPNYDSRDNCNAIIETATNTLLVGCMNTIIPKTVTSIDNNAFRECSRLSKIVIPNHVTSIGYDAFLLCSGLTNIVIPNSVTNIYGSAFGGCSGLTNVTIGRSVTDIGNYAFEGCTSLTSVTCLATTPPAIGNEMTFPDYVTSQATLYVPKGTENAYKDADYWKNFFNIVGIFVIDDFKVDGIYYHALTEKTAIVIQHPEIDNYYRGDVIIPDSISYQDMQFAVVGIDDGAFEDCAELTNVAIGDLVEIIGEDAFRGCTNLRNVTFGSKVATIGEMAFNSCDALQTVTCRGNIPPMMADINCFSTTAYNQTSLHVPRKAMTAYSIADYWYKFSNIEGWGSSGPGDADGDGKISIADVVAIIDYLLGNTEGEFYEDAADVTGNGDVNIADAVELIDILLAGGN